MAFILLFMSQFTVLINYLLQWVQVSEYWTWYIKSTTGYWFYDFKVFFVITGPLFYCQLWQCWYILLLKSNQTNFFLLCFYFQNRASLIPLIFARPRPIAHPIAHRRSRPSKPIWVACNKQTSDGRDHPNQSGLPATNKLWMVHRDIRAVNGRQFR